MSTRTVITVKGKGMNCGLRGVCVCVYVLHHTLTDGLFRLTPPRNALTPGCHHLLQECSAAYTTIATITHLPTLQHSTTPPRNALTRLPPPSSRVNKQYTQQSHIYQHRNITQHLLLGIRSHQATTITVFKNVQLQQLHIRTPTMRYNTTPPRNNTLYI